MSKFLCKWKIFFFKKQNKTKKKQDISNIFFFLILWYAFTYSKANYQTNVQIPYAALHKLQIKSGTSVQIRVFVAELAAELKRKNKMFLL